MKRGDGFFEVIKRMGDESRKEKDDFNENHPPHKEVTIYDSESMESTVVGVWFNENGAIEFSHKLPNGKYDPYRMLHVPKEIVNAIRNS